MSCFETRRANLYMRDPRVLSSEYRDPAQGLVVFLVVLTLVGLTGCILHRFMRRRCGLDSNRAMSGKKAGIVAAGKVHECASLKEMEDCIATSELCFVKFYAEWCGHCQAMKSHYDDCAKILGSKVTCLKINCPKLMDQTAMEKYEIKGFPTVRIYYNHGQKFEEHQGERTAVNLAETAKRHM